MTYVRYWVPILLVLVGAGLMIRGGATWTAGIGPTVLALLLYAEQRVPRPRPAGELPQPPQITQAELRAEADRITDRLSKDIAEHIRAAAELQTLQGRHDYDRGLIRVEVTIEPTKWQPELN